MLPCSRPSKSYSWNSALLRLVQRGNSVVYANRVAREILHLEEGAVLAVDDLFRGQFPDLPMPIRGSRCVGLLMFTDPAAWPIPLISIARCVRP